MSSNNDDNVSESAAESGLNAAAKTKKAGNIFQRFFGAIGDGLKFVSKKIPVLGAVVTAGFVLKESITHAVHGRWKMAGASFLAGVPEVAGNFGGILTSGLGELGREGIRGVFMKWGGNEYKNIQRSDYIVMGGWVGDNISNIFNRNATPPGLDLKKIHESPSLRDHNKDSRALFAENKPAEHDYGTALRGPALTLAQQGPPKT